MPKSSKQRKIATQSSAPVVARECAVPSFVPRGKGATVAKTIPFSLADYKIEWRARTGGYDWHMGGLDFKRMVMTGSLMFHGETVGVIECVRINRGWITNHYGDDGSLFDVFDETAEWEEMYAVAKQLSDDTDWETEQGELLIVDRIIIDAAHRGHNLGLFLIEAADSVHSHPLELV